MIQDRFTHLPISRQRKWQLRQQALGQCTQCGEPAISQDRCLDCLIASREAQRAKRRQGRRYLNSLSYRLESAAEKLGF